MSDRKRYYVYVHKLDGVIVYIGKGTRCRLSNKSYRNPEHLRVWDELEKVKIAENLTEDEAYDLEQKFLDEYFDTNLLFNVNRKTDRPKVIEYAKVSNIFRYDENSPSGIVWVSDKYAGKGRERVVATAGNHAGGLDSKTGYYRVRMNGTLFLTHRLVYCLMSCHVRIFQ